MNCTCIGCGRKFDYDQNNGICPKCGAFNAAETKAEQHEKLHERMGDNSHRTYGHKAGGFQDAWYDRDNQVKEGSAYGESAEADYANGSAYAEGALPLIRRSAGQMKLAAAIFAVGLFLLIDGSVCTVVVSRLSSQKYSEAYASVYESLALGDEYASDFPTTVHEMGESFLLQDSVMLTVTECRILADHSTLESLDGNLKLVAVRVEGESNGEYENDNHILTPYLEANGTYREAISSTTFEAYGDVFGAFPAMDGYELCWDTFCDGWYGFLMDTDADTARIWFYEFEGEYYNENLTASHCVELTFDAQGEDGK